MPEFIIEGQGNVRRVVVDKDEIVIGRDAGADLVIEDDSVSRRHCAVKRGDTGWFLQDLGSSNGTYVGETRVVRAAIRRGVVFSAGNYDLTFLVADDPVEAPALEAATAADAPKIAGFTPIRYLGEGLFSRVFSMQPEGGGANVIVRELRARWRDDAELQRWLSETIEAARGVDHPSLAVPVLVRAEDGTFCLKERLADRGTLGDRLASGPRLNLIESLDLINVVVMPLKALHRAGFVHGGIRPDKVLFYGDAPPRLSVPGVPARVLSALDDGDAASIQFMAPEAFSEVASVTKASDVFSVGALLHLLILGVPIGEGTTRDGVVRSIQRGLRKPPKERRSDISQGLADLITKCLELEPASRPGIEQVADALSALLAESKSRPQVERRPIEVKPREVGERVGPPRKSLRFRVLSWSVTVFLFGAGYVFVDLFFVNMFGKIRGCRGGQESSSVREEVEPAPVRREPPPKDATGESAAVTVVKDADLRRELHQLMVEDRYMDALRWIADLDGDGRLESGVAAERQADVETKQAARKTALVSEVRAALEQRDAATSHALLDRLQKVVGDADVDFVALLEGYMALR